MNEQMIDTAALALAEDATRFSDVGWDTETGIITADVKMPHFVSEEIATWYAEPTEEQISELAERISTHLESLINIITGQTFKIVTQEGEFEDEWLWIELELQTE